MSQRSAGAGDVAGESGRPGRHRVGDRVVYTLGTSNRSADEFLALLRDLDAEVVVDVRRFPRSRYGHFDEAEFASLVEHDGLGYVYLGDELGGSRTGGYEAYLRTEAFIQGVERLAALARAQRAIVVCAERLPWRCHRRFIGRELERRGLEVVHVIEAGRRWTPGAGVNGGR